MPRWMIQIRLRIEQLPRRSRRYARCYCTFLPLGVSSESSFRSRQTKDNRLCAVAAIRWSRYREMPDQIRHAPTDFAATLHNDPPIRPPAAGLSLEVHKAAFASGHPARRSRFIRDRHRSSRTPSESLADFDRRPVDLTERRNLLRPAFGCKSHLLQTDLSVFDNRSRSGTARKAVWILIFATIIHDRCTLVNRSPMTTVTAVASPRTVRKCPINVRRAQRASVLT